MLVLDFLTWWYVAGWLNRLKVISRNISGWVEYFSIGTLLKTLFKPWRQTVTLAGPNQNMQRRMNAMVDNFVSRMVGFFLRISVLIAAFFVVCFVLVADLVIFVVWPVLPVAPVIVVAVGLGQ